MLYLLENTLLGAGNRIYHRQALTFFQLMVVQYITRKQHSCFRRFGKTVENMYSSYRL